jgi:peroxiredoxin
MKLFLPIGLLTALVLSIALSGAYSGPRGYVVGDVADDFSLINVKGDSISLSSYGKVNGYIIVFTCNHCPYAQMYEQRVIDLHKTFVKRGFPVVAINPNSPAVVPDDSYEEMQSRASKGKYPFHYLFDEEQKVYPAFGATRTPHVFILDSTRTVRYIGAIDDNPETPAAVRNFWVKMAIDSLLVGKNPMPDFTRAVGCTVKKGPGKK